MSINGIGALLNTAQSASTISESKSINGGKQSERDMFMTLLVTQLKHQDPLEPQDGTQFVTQLAQFNQLDQLIGIKEALEQLIALSNRANQTDSPVNLTLS